MKKFLFSVLMAALAFPMTQAADKPVSPFMLRGNGHAMGTMIKTKDLSKITFKTPMLRGENQILWDFEDEAQLNDWMALDNDGDGYNWIYQNNAGLEQGKITVHSGTGAIYSESYSNDNYAALSPDNWLISPVVTLGGGLTLWACGQDPNYASEVFGVYVCVGTPTSIYDFVQVGADVTTTSTMTEYSFDLSAYNGQQGCIAIVHHNCYNEFMLVVDDICIDPDMVIIPDPTTPTNLTADPTATTANVAWTDNDDAAWNLRYRVYTPNAAQSFHWSAEADEDMSGWMLWDADGDGNNWGISQYNGCADGESLFFSASYNGSALSPDNWLFTPEVAMGGTLKFWAASYLSNWPDKFAVYMVPDVDDESTYVEIYPETTATADGTYYTIDLSEYAGQTGRFAFRHFNSDNNYYLFIDDITYDMPGEEEAEWIYVYGLDNMAYTIEGLTPETTYEVQVQAYNANQVESAWTASTLFTTLAEQAEQTEAPSISADTQQGVHAYFVTITPSEESDLYYRYCKDNGEWSDWILYDGVVPFEEDGYYQVEAYAIADDKTESLHVSCSFTVTPRTGLDELSGDKAVAGVRFFNAMGQEMAQPEGLTIVVTTYTDGTSSAVKVIK